MNSQPNRDRLASNTARWSVLVLAGFSMMVSGCASILNPIDAIPAERVPPQLLAERQADKRTIDLARLRQPKPDNYFLDSEDVLGIYIENVLGNESESPPVSLPDAQSDLPPAIGFPIPVREDGTISLPLVGSIPVRGLTLRQAEELIKKTYIEGRYIKDAARFIVTLIRKRTYRVFVVRQDNTSYSDPRFRSQQGGGRAVTDRSDFSSRGFVLQLPAYENDLLNALSQTGGIPGVNAKSEVRILRGDRTNFEQRDRQMQQFYQQNPPSRFPGGLAPEPPEDLTVTRVPLRLAPGEIPRFRPEDIILRDGDIVYVDTRETDIYYTGGLLGGGEFPLPRDYDLDVLGAVALAGGTVGSTDTRVSGLIGGVGTVPPTELIVLRKLPGQQQIAIRISLAEAVNNPRARILVKAGDTLILRYAPEEEATNFFINVFFTFGISELLRNN